MRHTNSNIRKIFIILSFVWAVAVAYACLKTPSMKPPPAFLCFPHADKLVHFMMHFGMGFLLFFSIAGVPSRSRYTIVFMTSFLYGLSIELLQHSMALGRAMDRWDIVANTVGVCTFLLLAPYANILLGKLMRGFVRS